MCHRLSRQSKDNLPLHPKTFLIMKQEEKKKKVLKIADDLDGLGYSGIAQMLRDAVNSGKAKSNDEDNEGGKGQQNPQPRTGGPQPPPDKERP
jgi:hypothetical protein